MTKLSHAFDAGHKPEMEKIPVSECPTIEADANEVATGPICSDYFCWRDCSEGFKPTHPMKVCSKLFSLFRRLRISALIAQKI